MPPPPFQWTEHTLLYAALRGSRVAVPLIETVHLLAIAVAVGAIAVIDLTVLGLAIRRDSAPRVARDLDPWISVALITAFVTGILLFWAEAVKLACKPFFWAKLALLGGTLIYHFASHRKAVLAAHKADDRRLRITAAVSLVLWFAVALGGKAIGLL